jgi:hypothetical protein
MEASKETYLILRRKRNGRPFRAGIRVSYCACDSVGWQEAQSWGQLHTTMMGEVCGDGEVERCVECKKGLATVLKGYGGCRRCLGVVELLEKDAV